MTLCLLLCMLSTRKPNVSGNTTAVLVSLEEFRWVNTIDTDEWSASVDTLSHEGNEG